MKQISSLIESSGLPTPKIKVTTDTGKTVSSFTMWCEFYTPFVDKDTGEIKPGEFTFRGDIYKRNLAIVNIKCDTELDALLYWFHKIQRKVAKAIFYDNSIPGTTDAIIFEVDKGIFNRERNKLKQYPLMVKKLIPNFRIIPHEIKIT